jgi:hypothetical protein
MGQTAGGLPYPEPTMPVRDGAAAIKALADALQTRGAGARWVVDKQNVTTGSTGYAVVTYPGGPFNGNPIVAGLIEWTYGNVLVSVDAAQGGGALSTAFYMRLVRPDGSYVMNAPVLISYIAVGNA